jgi:hypothetical protein
MGAHRDDSSLKNLIRHGRFNYGYNVLVIDDERQLRRTIRFLPSPIVAIGLIIGFAMMEADFAAVHASGAVMTVVVWQLLLVWNLLARRHYQIKLKRLLDRSSSTDSPNAAHPGGIISE